MFIARWGVASSASTSATTSSLLTGLVSYWKLNDSAGSGTAIDELGSNNGTVNATHITQNVSGRINSGCDFSSSGFDIGIDCGSTLKTSTSSWTVSCWIKYNGTVGRVYFIEWGAASGVQGIRLESDTDYHGTLVFGGVSDYEVVTSGLSTDLSDGSWHNVVGVVDRTGNIQIWIDGVGGNTFNISSYSSDDVNNSTNFEILKAVGSSVDVIVDEVGLWNRALTSTEISYLYNSRIGYTYPFTTSPLINQLVSYWKLDETSGNAADSYGTNTGTASNITYSNAGIINNCFTFNGTTSKVDCGNSTSLDLTSAGTISAWFNWTFDNTTYYSIVSKGDFDNDRYGYNILIAFGSIEVQLANSSTHQTFNPQIGGGGIATNDPGWHHVVMTWDGSNINFYYDGVAATTVTQTVSPVSNSYNFGIGWIPHDNGYFFPGKIDEVGAWSRAISADEVKFLYNSGSGKSYSF